MTGRVELISKIDHMDLRDLHAPIFEMSSAIETERRILFYVF